MMTREPHTVRASLQRDALLLEGSDLTKGHKGSIVGVLNTHTGNDASRKILLSWVFDWTPEKRVELKSTKTLTEGQWRALSVWIDAYQDGDTLEWLLSERFLSEVKAVTNIALAFYDSTHVSVVDELLDDYPMTKEAVVLGGVVKDD